MCSSLREVRTEKKLTQSKLAELAGTTQTVISYIETGKCFPSQKTRDRLTGIVGEVDWLKTMLDGLSGMINDQKSNQVKSKIMREKV